MYIIFSNCFDTWKNVFNFMKTTGRLCFFPLYLLPFKRPENRRAVISECIQSPRKYTNITFCDGGPDTGAFPRPKKKFIPHLFFQ